MKYRVMLLWYSPNDIFRISWLSKYYGAQEFHLTDNWMESWTFSNKGGADRGIEIAKELKPDAFRIEITVDHRI